MFSAKGYRPRTQEKLDSCGWQKIQKVSVGRESGEVGIFLLVGCEIREPQGSISVWYSNFWSKLQELPDTDLRNRPLCSKENPASALALLLQTSGAGFNRRTAHIPNSCREAT